MVSKRQIQELKRKCTYGFCALLFYYIGFRSEFNRIFRNQNIIKLKHQKYKENSENISSLRSSAISTKCSKNHLFCVRHKEYEIKTNFHIMNKLSIYNCIISSRFSFPSIGLLNLFSVSSCQIRGQNIPWSLYSTKCPYAYNYDCSPFLPIVQYTHSVQRLFL